MSSAAVHKFGIVENGMRCSKKINKFPFFNYRYLGSIPSDCLPTLLNSSFAIINTEPSNMKAKHRRLIANSRHKLNFAETGTCKVLFTNAPLQAFDARATTVPSQRLWPLHDRCRFPSLQIPARRKTGVQDIEVLS